MRTTFMVNIDGSPFDGSGSGRAWRLFTGERAHFELAAGRLDEARRMQETMQAFANDGGMIPEQVWDQNEIPESDLLLGRPTGSAMPLVWAHAKYIKLYRSLSDEKVFDMPPQTVDRYLKKQTGTPYAIWRFTNKCETIPIGKRLRLEVLASAMVHWSVDGWSTVHDANTRDTGLGILLWDLPTDSLPSGTEIVFTLFWHEAAVWEGTNFVVRKQTE